MSNFGAGGTAQIIAQIAAQRPDAYIEVNPKFSASNVYNQYPSIAEGITRANALVGLGANLVDVSYRGVFAEDNLVVGKDVILSGTPGSKIIGLPSPIVTDPIVELTENGIFQNGIIEPQVTRDYALTARKTTNQALVRARNSLIKIPASAGVIVGSAIKIFEAAADPAGDQNTKILADNVFIDVGEGILLASTFLNCVWVEGKGKIVMNNCSFITALGLNMARLQNTGSLTGANRCLEAFNSVLLNIGANGTTRYHILGDIWTRADVRGSVTEPRFCSFVDVDALNFWPYDSLDLSQTAYPEAPSSKGSIQYALATSKADIATNLNTTEINASNIGLAVAEMERAEGVAAGDYENLLLESYDNDDDIDTVNSQSYELEGGSVDFLTHVDIDDFEGYADTPALQAIWAPDGASNLTDNLLTTGGYLGGQAMEIVFNGINSSNGYIQKDYGGSRPDWTFYNDLKLAIRATGLSETIELIVELEDYGTNSAKVGGLYISADQPWLMLNLDFNDFTVDPGFEWWNIRYIRFNCGSVTGSDAGTWEIDILSSDIISKFTQSSLIDSLDAIGTPGTDGWSLSVGSITPTSGSQREGTGNFQIPIPAAGNIILTRDWPGSGTYAPNISADTAMRLWARQSSGTFTIAQLWLTLTDESGDKVAIQFANSPSFSSTITVWTPMSWILSSFKFIAPSTSFNFAQVVKMEFQTNGITGGPGVLELDLFESGDSSLIIENQQDISAGFSEIKAYAPSAGSIQYVLDVSGANSPGFNLAQLNDSEYNWGIKIGDARDFGEWLAQTNTNDKLQFRLVGVAISGESVTKVSGVSILWRN